MIVQISGYEFEGPYSIDTTVISADRAAVYVIICSTLGKSEVIDVGESGEVGVRIANHDRRPCWVRNCNGSLYVYLRYMPSAQGYTADDRRALERKIRSEYTVPCGVF
jgi:hypothetical protein